MKLSLKNLTIACVNTEFFTHEPSKQAALRTLRLIDPQKFIYFGVDPLQIGESFEPIPIINNIAEYSQFVLKDLYKYIDTDFVLIIQWDGYVANPQFWHQDFFDYDYIGAPWGWLPEGSNIGNGGFSLRSRKLLTACQDPSISIRPDIEHGIYEDVVIGQIYRTMLEANGIKFASTQLAEKFSYETGPIRKETFGFHGPINLPFFIPEDDLIKDAPFLIKKIKGTSSWDWLLHNSHQAHYSNLVHALHQTYCPICNQQANPLGAVSLNKSCNQTNSLKLDNSEESIEFFRCVSCHHIFIENLSQWSRKNLSEKIYNSEFDIFDPDFLELRPRANSQYLVSLLGEQLKRLRHLDFGSGNGLLSELLSKLGTQSTSYDPYMGEYQTLADSESYDLITAFEVFQHLNDPKEALRKMGSMLNENGIILFSTLLSDSEISEGRELNWWYVAPRNGHVSLFSKNSLELLGKQFGFQLFSLTPNFHIFYKTIPQWAVHFIPSPKDLNPSNSENSSVTMTNKNLEEFPEWIDWLRGNLERKCDPAVLEQTLIENQFSQKSITGIIDKLSLHKTPSEQAQIYFAKGCQQLADKNQRAAIASFNLAIAERSDYADAYYYRGNAFLEIYNYLSAIESYDQALAYDAESANIHFNRGAACMACKDYEQAVLSFGEVVRIQPNYASAHNNRGLAFQNLLQLDLAIDCFEKAVLHDPNMMGARLNLSLCLLLKGDYERGWQALECRWEKDGYCSPEGRNFIQPRWYGKESLKGKTVLLYGEQGLGDAIQFARFIPQVAALGAKIILEAPRPLVSLLSHIEGISQIIARGDAHPAFDLHCPLLSLPLALKTRLNNIPAAQGYLFANEEKIAYWKEKIGKNSKPLVGLVWGGNSIHQNDHHRSITLAQFVNFLNEQCSFVSLQNELKERDKAPLLNHPEIQYFGSEIKDFADTAALCSLMDVIITVDTSVAHLAGALGKPTWLLLPHLPDWRWLLERSDSPWYQTFSLYRQTQIGDWSGVLEKIKQDLTELQRSLN
ncbi:methyltransferase domain-containing protein [Polynucleobacter paneuropaeus]|nr:methyltransferase domain-containing protein [Polynucleobacter paneuropaeus]